MTEEQTLRFLQSKGYGNEIKEYKNIQKLAFKENTHENRINFRDVVFKLNNLAKNELEESRLKGNLDDEFHIINKGIHDQKAERQAFEGTYGSVPENYSVDQAYRLRLAEEAYENDPSTTNASRVILAKARGDLQGRHQEQRVEEHRSMQQRMKTGFEKEIHTSQETKEAKAAKLEEEEKLRQEDRQKIIDSSNDIRTMHSSQHDTSSTPLERQMEAERIKNRKVKNEFDEREGY